MKTIFQFNDAEYSADLTNGVSIARLPQIEDADFDAGKIEVQRIPFIADDFVGDVSAGGSCNVDVLKINPHCSCTHTETLLHILDRTKWPLEEVSVASVAAPIFLPCVLVTVNSAAGTDVRQNGESYLPEIAQNDLLITAESLTSAFHSLNFQPEKNNAPFAIVIRTKGSETWSFRSPAPVPYLTRDAMSLISASNCQHLLVDLPSVDRRADEGLLSNHHLFWNVAADQSNPLDSFRTDRTITEMVSVPSQLSDGVYLLDLQTVPLATDAAPSRPVLIRAAV